MKKYRGIIISFAILSVASYVMFTVAQDGKFVEATGSGELSVFAYLACLVFFGISLLAFLWQFYQFRSPSRDRRELIERSVSDYTATHLRTDRYTVEHRYIEELLLTQSPVELPQSTINRTINVHDVVELTDPHQELSVFVVVLEKTDTTMTVEITKRPTRG